jgi:hypothetical protein
MRQVIKSDIDCGDGVSIEREQPSTAFRSMPHIKTWDGLLVASGRDELIGNFDHYTKPDLSYANKEIRPVKAVTETDAVGGITQLEFNPSPFQKGSAIFPGHGVIAEDHSAGSFEPRQAKLLEADRYQGPGNEAHPRFQEINPEASKTVIHPNYRPEADGFMKLGDISGEGVFKPQDIDTKGSVIFGDNHFTPDRGGDSITGEGRRMKIWGNGGASTFEDSNGFLDVGNCGVNLKSDADLNDVVIGVKENIDWTAANGGPGSSYLAAKTASQSNAYVDEDVDGFMKLGDIKGELQTTHLRSDNRFVIEGFEPAAGMNSFGESWNPALQHGGNPGPFSPVDHEAQQQLWSDVQPF